MPAASAGGSGTDTPGDRGALEAYLHRHIPLSAAMETRVEVARPGEVVLSAPLPPNLNHRATAFGGSLASLAILAGWALAHVRLARAFPVPVRIVIQRSSLDYLRPVEERFEAACRAPSDEAWSRFLTTLQRRGRARIELSVEMRSAGKRVGTFRGAYAALRGAAQEG